MPVRAFRVAQEKFAPIFRAALTGRLAGSAQTSTPALIFPALQDSGAQIYQGSQTQLLAEHALVRLCGCRVPTFLRSAAEINACAGNPCPSGQFCQDIVGGADAPSGRTCSG